MTSSLDLIRGRQVVQTLTNKSGGGVIAGDVVIIDTANDESFTTTTTAAYNASQVCIALDTIANNATGRILLQGYAPLVNVSASATRGYYLFSHTVAKQATSSATFATGAFGQVLKAGTTPSAYIFPPALSAAAITRSGSTTDAHLAVWNGSNADSLKDGGTVSSSIQYPANGRLTLTSGTPVTTADVTAAGTLYYTPYLGDQIALYNGASWDTLTFTEKSLSLTLTSAAVYDIFAYNNSGTVTLESLVWTSPTARATALAYQNGILCKTGALTRRYLGTICASGTNTTEDSTVKRFVWNYYNRLPRLIYKTDVTNHTYSTGVRYWNNDNTQNVYYCAGLVEETMQLGLRLSSADANGQIGCDQDSATAMDHTLPGAGAVTGGENIGYTSVLPLLGSHYIAILEQTALTSVTFYEYTMTGHLRG